MKTENFTPEFLEFWEFAESCVKWDLEYLAREAAERERCACADIATVAA